MIKINYNKMTSRILYSKGQAVIVHDLRYPEKQYLARIITNIFTGKQVIDANCGQVNIDKLPEFVYYVLIPNEEKEIMWAILNDCYDENEEISQCMNCNTKISKHQAHIWSDQLVICKFCP